MESFLITLLLLLLGMALKRLPSFPAETGNVLNLFVIYISLPALVLLKVPELKLSGQLLAPALMPWVMLLLSSGLVIVLSKIMQWDRATTGCLLLLVPLGNTSFLGIPLVKAFYGEAAVPYALLYDQLGSFLALATYGSLILALYGESKVKPTARTVLVKVLSFPPFIALLLAFVLRQAEYPHVVLRFLEMTSATLVPLVMIAVGFQLQLRLGKGSLAPLGLGLAIKLIAAPLIALLLCRALGLEGAAVKVSIFEAGMPPMVSAGALAIMANLAPRLAAALVGIGILLCFATLPLLFQLI